MKNKIIFFSILSFLALTLNSCKLEDPEFKSISGIEMSMLQDGNFLVKATAELYNPNKVGITIKEIHVDVIVNDEAVGTVDQLLEQQINKQSDFQIPLEIKFPPKLLFSNMLLGMFNLATEQEMVIKYDGYVKAKALGVTWTIPVKDKTKIEFKG